MPLPPFSELDAILFDMDGVVIDSEPLHSEAKRIVLAELGLSLPEAEFETFLGRTDRDVMTYIVERYAPFLDPFEVIRRKQNVYAGLIPKLELVPGVLTLIRGLHDQHKPLALVTSATARNQRLAFDKFDLHPWFVFSVTAGDVVHHKPHPEPYQTAVDRLNLPAERCLVIEDSVNGVRSAKAAGCHVAGLTTSTDAQPLEAAGADVVVASFSELTDLLPPR